MKREFLGGADREGLRIGVEGKVLFDSHLALRNGGAHGDLYWKMNRGMG